MTMTVSAILTALVICASAPPYDDCAPVIAAARANPDTRLTVEAVEAVFADPALYARVRDSDAEFFGWGER